MSITDSYGSGRYAQFYNALVTEHGLALRDVYLGVHFPVAFPTDFQLKLFRLAHWPELRRFTICGSASALINLDDFINRHRNLKALSLNGSAAPILKAAQLPNLQSLKFLWPSKRNPFTIPREIAKGLKHFGPRVSSLRGMQVFQHMKSLQTASLDGIPSISKFVGMVPNLERLCYRQPKSSTRARRYFQCSNLF